MNQGQPERPSGYRAMSSPIEGKPNDFRRSNSRQRRRSSKERSRPYYERDERSDMRPRQKYDDYQRKQIPKSHKLFISNIDGRIPAKEVQEGLLKEFDYFGPIAQIIVKTKFNSSNTYAFIQYQSIRDSSLALKEMNGKSFKGQYLRVQFSKGEKNNRQKEKPRHRYRDRSPQPRNRSRDRSRDRSRERYERRYQQKRHNKHMYSPDERRMRSRSRQKHHQHHYDDRYAPSSRYRRDRSPSWERPRERRRTPSPEHYERRETIRRKSPQHYERRRY